jgi:hypothetical protein
MRVDLGDQITEQNILTQCEENYRELLEKIESKRHENSSSEAILAHFPNCPASTRIVFFAVIFKILP